MLADCRFRQLGCACERDPNRSLTITPIAHLTKAAGRIRRRHEYLTLYVQILSLNPLNRRRLAANEDVFRLLLVLVYACNRAIDDRLRVHYLDMIGFLGLYHVRESDGRLVRRARHAPGRTTALDTPPTDSFPRWAPGREHMPRKLMDVAINPSARLPSLANALLTDTGASVHPVVIAFLRR